MASIEIGAGTTFNFKIPLPNLISTYENILVALYTNAASPVKFSYVARTGMNKLNEGSTALELVGVLTGAQTANMRGELYMELRNVDDIGAAENLGNSKPTLVGVEIVTNVLKNTL